MKRKIFAFLILFFSVSNTAMSDEIVLEGVEKHKVKYSPRVEKDVKTLTLDDETAIKGVVYLQQQQDLEDIDALWKSTIESNSLIKFAIQKLSLPPEQQRYHSSVLAKSVSALINGASFVPSLFGANYMVQSASYATGRLANNYISRAKNPKEIPLTDTELIELAGMIESLQDQIINSYYNYKTVLSQIKDTRQQLVIYNKNYAEAIRKGNEMEIFVSSSMYDDLLFEEARLMKEARKYQMDLERLAGKKTVEELHLCQYAFKNELFSQNVLKTNAENDNKEQGNDKK